MPCPALMIAEGAVLEPPEASLLRATPAEDIVQRVVDACFESVEEWRCGMEMLCQGVIACEIGMLSGLFA